MKPLWIKLPCGDFLNLATACVVTEPSPAAAGFPHRRRMVRLAFGWPGEYDDDEGDDWRRYFDADADAILSALDKIAIFRPEPHADLLTVPKEVPA